MKSGGISDLSLAAVIITLNRPRFVSECLSHLERQTSQIAETVVVDASPNDQTFRLVQDQFPHVRYLRNPFGPGTMATSRNMALTSVTSDIVAFIDDDAYARPDWARQIRQPYDDPAVGAVGGRACNGVPGEDVFGIEEIGRFRPDGTLTGNFAADPPDALDVDHLLGANMSYRRHVLEEIGGIRDFYPGTCLREDTDLAHRVRTAGYRVIFTPSAVVDHVAAPYMRGRRFDLRYNYWAQRNHIVFLSRTVGRGSSQLRGYRRVAAREVWDGLLATPAALAEIPQRGITKAGRHAAGEASRAAARAAGLLSGTLLESRTGRWARSRDAR